MYKFKEIVECKIININSSHLIIKTNHNWKGIIHISQLSDYYISNINYFAKVNDTIFAEVIKIDKDKKTLGLSYKNINPKYLKNPFKYEIKETINGFKNLKLNTIKELEND